MSEHDDMVGDEADDAVTAALMADIGPTLRDAAVWDEPPAWLAESIVAAIAQERDTERDASPATVTAPPIPARRSRPPRQTWWLAAAAAVVALAAVGVVALRDGGGDTGEALAVEGTELAPGASAEAFVTQPGAGAAIRLDIEGLPPAPEGQYYQGWVRSDDGELVSIGTFHMRDGDSTVTLWAGVDLDVYNTVTVTIQQEGAGPESSGEVVLRGSLRP